MDYTKLDEEHDFKLTGKPVKKNGNTNKNGGKGQTNNIYNSKHVRIITSKSKNK